MAINTTAGREMAVQDLMRLGILPYTDMVVCGDDDPSKLPGKSPDIVHLICEELGVAPEKAVVVGDTMADITMGLEASVGLTVGVLTGVGSYKELVQADHIVPTVSKVLELVSADTLNCTESDGECSGVMSGRREGKGDVGSGVRHYSTQAFSSPGQRKFSALPRVKVQPDIATFDYIIVGAGSAGCVLANRLSQDPNTKVVCMHLGV